MRDRRHKNVRWQLPPLAENGHAERDAVVTSALLMDIRDELQALNRLLHCRNFVAIPRKLDAIHRKLPTRRKKKATP